MKFEKIRHAARRARYTVDPTDEEIAEDSLIKADQLSLFGLKGKKKGESGDLFDRGAKAKQQRPAGPRPPKGYMPVKNSKRGGYYKMSGGRRVYWYPDTGHVTPKAKPPAAPQPAIVAPAKKQKEAAQRMSFDVRTVTGAGVLFPDQTTSAMHRGAAARLKDMYEKVDAAGMSASGGQSRALYAAAQALLNAQVMHEQTADKLDGKGWLEADKAAMVADAKAMTVKAQAAIERVNVAHDPAIQKTAATWHDAKRWLESALEDLKPGTKLYRTVRDAAASAGQVGDRYAEGGEVSELWNRTAQKEVSSAKDALRKREDARRRRRTRKSFTIGQDLLQKAKPPGSGWTPVGKKGGYRRGAQGNYEYWYPGVGITSRPHADDAADPKKKQKPGKERRRGAMEGAVTLDVEKRKQRRKEKGEGEQREVITDPSELPADFNKLPKATRAVMTADYDNVVQGMTERMGAPRKYKGDVAAAISSHVDELAKNGHIVPSNADRAKKMMVDQYEHGKAAGVDEALLAEIVEENVRKLAHQEVEAARRTLGDHGVRHLSVNATQSDAIFDELEKGGVKISPMQRFMAYQVWIDHDMGYTIPAIAQGGFAVKDNYHPQASTVMSFQQRDKFTKAFGNEKNFKQYVAAVANHSGSTVNWKADPFGSAVRLADNTHLFADKMPEVLFNSDKAVEAMVKIKLAGDLVPGSGKDGERTPEEKARYKQLVAGVKNDLVSEIRKREDLPDNTKANLLKAAQEVGAMTPKFLISRLAGRSPRFAFDGTDMKVTIEQSNVRHTIGEVFGPDEEDKQFVKLLSDYGTDPKAALGAEPPPPHVKVSQKGRGGINFTWESPKDEHPAERRHIEVMRSSKAEFDKVKGMSDGDEKNAAMDKFFGVTTTTEKSMSRRARIKAVTLELDPDEALAKALESGEVGIGHATRLGGSPSMRKGTIYQGETVVIGDKGDQREAVARTQTLHECTIYDPDGTAGNGGLEQWYDASLDPDVEADIRVPLNLRVDYLREGGMVKSAPPTQVIDTGNPSMRQMHRLPTADGGARTDLETLYQRKK